MNSVTIYKVIAAAALALSMETAVLADDNNESSWWSRWGMGRMMGWGMYEFGPDTVLDRIDGRLAYLKAELRITDAQQPAWNELAKAVKTTANAHNAMMADMMKAMHGDDFWKKPLPERLTIHEAYLAARLEQVKAVSASVNGLYAVLTPDQKSVADDLVLPVMGMGMGRGMAGRMMMQW